MTSFLIFVPIFLLVIAVFLTLHRASRERQAQRQIEWKAQAKQLSFSSFKNDRFLDGVVGGRGVTVELEYRPGDSTPGYYVTKIRVSVAGAPADLMVRQEGFETSVLIGLGRVQETEVGDPEFDGLFVVQGGDEWSVRAWLNDERRAMFLRLNIAFSEVQFEDETIQVVVGSMLSGPGELVSVLRELLGIIDPSIQLVTRNPSCLSWRLKPTAYLQLSGLCLEKKTRSAWRKFAKDNRVLLDS